MLYYNAINSDSLSPLIFYSLHHEFIFVFIFSSLDFIIFVFFLFVVVVFCGSFVLLVCCLLLSWLLSLLSLLRILFDVLCCSHIARAFYSRTSIACEVCVLIWGVHVCVCVCCVCCENVTRIHIACLFTHIHTTVNVRL